MPEGQFYKVARVGPPWRSQRCIAFKNFKLNRGFLHNEPIMSKYDSACSASARTSTRLVVVGFMNTLLGPACRCSSDPRSVRGTHTMLSAGAQQRL